MGEIHIRLVIVEDDAALRRDHSALFNHHRGFYLVGTADSGGTGVELYQRMRPDVTIIDLHMSLALEMATIRSICRVNSTAAVLVLAPDTCSSHVLGDLEAGAAGYLHEKASDADLIEGVCAAYQHHMPLSLDARCLVVGSIRRPTADSPDLARPALTAREYDVLHLVAESLPNAQIAYRLDISPNVVKKHVSALLRKLGATNRTDLVMRATALGLVEPSTSNT